MFNGSIQSTGPRYCPSIEDKINRFADKPRHQIFVEPEGWNTVEVYVNGFSTSLPEDIQYKALKQVSGFENVKFFRPGYAIEYDYFPPTQLQHSLETKLIKGLYFAGQINGTTGYEEAAAQGIMAGINAHLSLQEKEPLVLQRNQAYIGVLIDDLILKGTEEPYRMFTSRAEYRTLLRQDNADQRLTPLSFEMGLASKARLLAVEKKEKETQAILSYLSTQSYPVEEANSLLEAKGSALIKQTDKYAKLLSRPQITRKDLTQIAAVQTYLTEGGFSEAAYEQAEIEIKYAGYIAKENKNADRLQKLEHLKIPAAFDYKQLKSLSNEALEKLNAARPQTLAQAARISGIKPSDISVILVAIGK
jgi:tRNA uridine 5-carboxymethylaminomethyl modification enzyme